MQPKTLLLENDVVRIGIHVSENGATSFSYMVPAGSEPQASCSPHFKDFAESTAPLVELRLSGEGNLHVKSAKAMIGSYVGGRLKYRKHFETTDEKKTSKTLNVVLYDEETKVSATSHLTIFDGLPFLQSSVTVCNEGPRSVVLYQVPSLVIGALTRSREWWHDYQLAYANNTWFREAQWVTHSLPSVGVDNFGIYEFDASAASLASFALSNHSSFSTQRHLPMGILKRRDDSETWLWQIENNSSWKWEIGDYKDNVYVAASGPNSDDHDWRHVLGTGAAFTSVTSSICHIYGNQEAAFAALTQYRRRIRRRHGDHEKLPIIFNDYMNCLMGDPTDEKILALVDPVAKSGAEYFVIDCGWYADDGNWWNDVGLWEPSKKRFPMGFQALLKKIRDAGLTPGLWIEPEVIGVNNLMAKTLPRECFFERDGERVVEKGRYQLDYRHPAVRERMNKVIDRCVKEYGAGYFKFDYNIEVTQGTDIDCPSSGVGQLDHGRAYLAWVNELLNRYPDLVIENCSSGAQRMDYAMLATHTLQSTSDQQSPTLYAAIAAGIPTAVTPEQGATWAYPQPDWPDEINALTVVNSLLGRIHLSGRLDIMSAEQLKIVYGGMKVYKDIRKDIPGAVPFWPLGLPSWHDDWVALGLHTTTDKERCYLAVWRRGGSTKCTLPVAPLIKKQGVKVDFLYPTMFSASSAWNEKQSSLDVELPETICARLFRLQA